MSLDELGVTFGYLEAIDLVEGLRAEWGSHTHASVHGWQFPMTLAAFANVLQAEKLINWFRNRDDKSPVFRLPRPWSDADVATPEEYEAAEKELLSRSAFAPD